MFARLALESECDDVVRLARMQVAETLPHLPFDEYRTRETFYRYIDTAHPTIFVADERSSVVGYLVAFIHDYAFADAQFVIQEALYVDPVKRGSRAASKLIGEFTRWGKQLGASEIIYGVSNGFQPDRTERFFELITGAERVGSYLKLVRPADGWGW
jgi:GNAT superfamily N-acetyltransferase